MVNSRKSGATTAAAILILANIILNAIALFQSDLLLLREQSIYIYTIVDLVYAAAFALLGIGLLTDNTALEKAGSYTGLAASVLKMAKACTWIVPNLQDMSGLEMVRYGANLIGMAAGIIGFLILARSFGVGGYRGKNSDKKLALIFLLASLILETFFAFMALYWGYYEFGELLKLQFTGQMSLPVNYLAMAGLMVYLFTSMKEQPAAQGQIPVGPSGYGAPYTPVPQQVPVTPVPQKVPVTPASQQAPVTPAPQQAPAAPAPQPVSAAQPDSERIQKIKMFKELKDLGIITEEEFFDRIRNL